MESEFHRSPFFCEAIREFYRRLVLTHRPTHLSRERTERGVGVEHWLPPNVHQDEIGDDVAEARLFLQRVERLLAVLSGLFGGLALLLAVVGLNGTMAYSVERRRNEIGIRIALGAARPTVMRLILWETGRLMLMGVVVGGSSPPFSSVLPPPTRPPG